MTPVDFLATAIAKFSDEPAHLGRVYNVVQQDPSSPTAFRSHGEPRIRNGSRFIADWKSRLQEMADRENDLELGVLIRSLESVEGYLSDTSSYDISKFSKASCGDRPDNSDSSVKYVTSFLRE